MGDITGVYSTDGGQTWYFPTYTTTAAQFSDFYNVTEDPNTGVLFAAAGTVNFLYKNSSNPNNSYRDGRGGGMDYSTDGGKTWSLLSQWANTGTPTTYNPVTDVVIDPSHPGRAYALVANSTNGGIWVTNNLYLSDGKTVNPNPTWTQLPTPTHNITTAFNYGGRQYSGIILRPRPLRPEDPQRRHAGGRFRRAVRPDEQSHRPFIGRLDQQRRQQWTDCTPLTRGR